MVADIPVNLGGIRPVGLHGHHGEALLHDQLTRDAITHLVEFRRAVRRLAQQDDPGVFDSPQQGPEVCIVDLTERLAAGCNEAANKE